MERCEEAEIEPKEHCMPRDLWKKKKLQEDIAAGNVRIAQGTLDGVVTKRDILPSFNAQTTLRAIAKYIVTKDVVCSVLPSLST